MKNTINFFRLIHRVTLITLVLVISLIPFIINITMVAIFVIFPALLILIFLLSIIIEQKLDSLSITRVAKNKKQYCSVRKCINKYYLS